MTATTAYILALQYVEATSHKLGAVKGAPCKIKRIDEVKKEGVVIGHEIIFSWKDDSNVEHESKLKVLDGETPLVFQKSPIIYTDDLKVNDYFVAPINQFNRQPFDGDKFFTYLITSSSKGVILLYAAVCRWEADTGRAYVLQFDKVATTGLKALTTTKPVDQDLTLDDSFVLPSGDFSRKPDGVAEECLVFDKFGHYRNCGVAELDDTHVTVTPCDEVVNINIGSVRYNHEQTEPSKDWEVQHNLNFLVPNVFVTDEDKNHIVGDLEFCTQNLLKIHFAEEQKGIAYISK